MKIAATVSTFVLALLFTACGSDSNQDQSCDECRQQNAPLSSAIDLEPGLQKSADQTPIQNVNDQVSSEDSGLAPQSVADTSNIEVSEELAQKIIELKSKESNEL